MSPSLADRGILLRPFKVEADMADPQDFSAGRQNVPVDTLVIHTTEGGSIESALAHWHRGDIVASCHYLIDGKKIVQNVAEGDTAFHAGNRAMNRRAIGIEVVGHCQDRNLWTPEIMAQLVMLAADICQRHGIAVKHMCPGIIGHCDVPDPYHPDRYGGASHHHDPGEWFPMLAFLDALRAELATKEIA